MPPLQLSDLLEYCLLGLKELGWLVNLQNLDLHFSPDLLQLKQRHHFRPYSVGCVCLTREPTPSSQKFSLPIFTSKDCSRVPHLLGLFNTGADLLILGCHLCAHSRCFYPHMHNVAVGVEVMLAHLIDGGLGAKGGSLSVTSNFCTLRSLS